MTNLLLGYLADVAGRTVAGVGSAIHDAITDSKKDDNTKDKKLLKDSRGRKAASSAEKSN